MRQGNMYNNRGGYPGQGGMGQFQGYGSGGGGNNFNPNMAGYGGVGQQGGMGGYQAFQNNYNQAPGSGFGQQQCGFNQFPGNNVPPQQGGVPAQAHQGQHGQDYGQNWTQQQQMQWNNNGMDQSAQSWNGQQANNWGNGVSPRTGTATPNHNMYPMPSQHNGQAGAKAEGKRPDAAKSNVEMQPEAYQRTLEYVQQCQSWSSTSVVSPDSSSVNNGAKQKQQSPGHPGADAQAMPPPAAMGSGAPSLAQMAPQSGAMTPRHAPAGAAATPVMGEAPKQAQDSSSNMVIADMSSSMNTLMEENRYLHMMQ